MKAVERVASVEARLVPHRWAWAEKEADAIAANFEGRRVLTPAIFDGPVLMVAASRRSGGALAVDFFATRYAALMAHLDFGCPDGSVANGFAMGALRAADGGFLLGLMAPHTAQAGQLYFPAGTPDPLDVRPDGAVDLEASIRREVLEETGIALSADDLGEGWAVVDVDGRRAFMRDVRLAADADTVRARVLAHLAREERPELADIVVVRRPSDIDPARMPGYLIAYLEDAFAGTPAYG